MLAINEIKVPDIGDFKDVPIIEVHVQPGASVNVDDPLVTLESDKATMDVPSTMSGTVEEILVKVGARVSEGAPIVRLRTEDAPGEAPVTPPPSVIGLQEPPARPRPGGWAFPRSRRSISPSSVPSRRSRWRGSSGCPVRTCIARG